HFFLPFSSFSSSSFLPFVVEWNNQLIRFIGGTRSRCGSGHRRCEIRRQTEDDEERRRMADDEVRRRMADEVRRRVARR
ncbi:hypothetical protein LINPERPRIM_LOCUS30473, partial [Linum perenne]